MSDTRTTDKIKTGVQGDVTIPKWLIAAITVFVLGLLSTAIWTTLTASRDFAIMSERQGMLRTDVKELKEKFDTAAADRFTGTEAAQMQTNQLAIREELARQEIRLREIERRLEALERP